LEPISIFDYEPPVPEVATTPTRVAKDAAFYAAAMSEDVQQSQGIYEQVVEDLTRFGSSPYIDDIKEKIAKEHKSKVADKANAVLMSYDKPANEKLTELQDLSSQQPPGIDDFFTQQYTLLGDTGSFNSQLIQANKSITGVDNLLGNQYELYDPERIKQEVEEKKTLWNAIKNLGGSMVDAAGVFGEEGFLQSVKGITQTTGAVVASLAYMIPAGFVGIYKVAKKDSQAAEVAIKAIMDASYRGDGKAYEAGMKVLQSVGEVFEVPFRAMGDTAADITLKITDSVEASAIAGSFFYSVPQVLGYAGAAKIAIKGAVKGQGAVQTVKGMVDAASPIKVFDRPVKTTVEGPVISDVFVGPRTPITRMEAANRPAAAEAIAKGLESTKMADALGTTPAGIIMHNYLPKFGDDVRAMYADIGKKIDRLDADALYHLEKTTVDPWLFDPVAIKNDKNLHAQIIQETSELVPQMSSSVFYKSTVDDTGRSYRAKMVYGSGDNKGFASLEEANLAKGKLAFAVASKYGMPQSGKGGNATWQKLAKDITVEEAPGGEFFVKWDFFRAYDPIQENISLIPSATFAGMDVTRFANYGIGKWIFNPATRLPKILTSGYARAELRSANLQKVWEDVIRDEILTTKPKKELDYLIKKGEDEGKHLTLQEIRDTYPNMPAKEFKSLVNGYEHYRRLDEHLYLTFNRIHRNQKITQGYVGLYDDQGRPVGTLGREIVAKQELNKDTLEQENLPKELRDEQGFQAEEVYDFTMKSEVDPVTGEVKKVHTGPIKTSEANVDGRSVFELDKPFTIGGKTYTYGVGARQGPVPVELLPRIPGHYPHINKEPYFIKAIPQELYINGRLIPKDSPGAEALYAKHATTVGVADTNSQGIESIKKYKENNPDYDYVVVPERTDIDKVLVTYLDAIKYGADLGKSRKTTRLTHGDGRLSTLEDVVVAMNQRLAEAAKLDAFKDIDFEFRQQFVRRFGSVTDHKFPETIQDIKLQPNKGDLNSQALVRDARTLYEQYMTFNKHAESVLDKGWKKGLMAVAYKLEDGWPKVSEAARWAASHAFPLERAYLNAATVSAIHLNFVKHWFVQPSQVHELAVLAATKGNFKAARDIYTLGPMIFSAIVGDNKRLPNFVRKSLGARPIDRRLGIDETEFQAIVQAFKDTGVPYALDRHASMDGILRSSLEKLVPTTGEKAVSRATKAATIVPQVGKTVGFTGAELANAIGMWLYARSDFIKNNPKKNWNDPHNREIIAERLWGIGNSMQTRGDLYPYQQGFLRGFLQFQAFSNKAALQVFSSKFLTKEEKIKLAAIRAISYGDKAIIVSTPIDLAVGGLEEEVYSHIDPNDKESMELARSFLEIYREGLGNKVGNYILSLIAGDDEDIPDLETEINFNKAMAPLPEHGLPLSDFVVNVWKISQGDKTVQETLAGPAAALRLVKVAADLHTIFELKDEIDTMDDVGKTKYLREVAKFAPAWNNFEKALWMKRTGQLPDKAGNPMEMEVTRQEVIAQALGLTTKKSELLYELQNNSFKISKYATETAKKIVGILDTMDWMRLDQDRDAFKVNEDRIKEVRALIDIYSANGYEREIIHAVETELIKQNKKGVQGVIDRLVKSRQDGWAKEEQAQAQKLKQLEGIVGKSTTDKINQLWEEIPQVNLFNDKGNE